MTDSQAGRIAQALDRFRIELPSWGFADTGTRFGKFHQRGAAVTIEEKFRDAAEVNRVTGICPTLALHVLWDFREGKRSADAVLELARETGVSAGAINPNLFQDQIYKFGSFGNPDPAVREAALRHTLDSIEIASVVGSRDISLWFADGSNYPGTQNIRQRRAWFNNGLKRSHDALTGDQRLLVEYKPFEPAFYHTDIADWGMALEFARAAGPRAKVLVDTGHHYAAQNIEQIVAWLLDLDMLGGFHFNDRRYADDDLTLGSIDPYQVFRIFHEIAMYEWETGRPADIAYMVDQSHNLKPKMEAMIQTATTAQEMVAKAAIVDHDQLAACQRNGELVDAENCLKDAFAADVRPVIAEWRASRGIPKDPLGAYREGGYGRRIEAERGGRKSAASSFA
jgi:L-rhamnose isomerase/sugar isomerase